MSLTPSATRAPHKKIARLKTQHLVEHAQKSIQNRSINYVRVATQIYTEATQNLVQMVDHKMNYMQFSYTTKCCLCAFAGAPDFAQPRNYVIWYKTEHPKKHLFWKVFLKFFARHTQKLCVSSKKFQTCSGKVVFSFGGNQYTIQARSTSIDLVEIL